MMKRLFVLSVLSIVLSIVLIAAFPAAAQDAISYRSQPDDLAVFLNDVAFVRDTVTLPGDTDVELVISGAIFSDTLILRENGERVRTYSLQSDGINTLVRWQADETDAALREVTIEYLMQGIHWTPKYDMFLTEGAETVDLDFFAEIASTGLEADDVNLKLIAGRVDTSQVVDTIGQVTNNQYIAGYDADGNFAPGQPLTGSATIQYVYNAGTIAIRPGEVVYTEIQRSTLPYRIVNLWNAPQSNQVDRIYKVKNTAELPLAEGIVRSYQDGLFIGSDFVEQTPVGSEGSVTLGKLQNIRVSRTETVTTVERSFIDDDTRHEIIHKISNFSDEAIVIDIVDFLPASAYEVNYVLEPQREGDNLLRWQVTVEPGETRELSFEYVAE